MCNCSWRLTSKKVVRPFAIVPLVPLGQGGSAVAACSVTAIATPLRLGKPVNDLVDSVAIRANYLVAEAAFRRVRAASPSLALAALRYQALV